MCYQYIANQTKFRLKLHYFCTNRRAKLDTDHVRNRKRFYSAHREIEKDFGGHSRHLKKVVWFTIVGFGTSNRNTLIEQSPMSILIEKISHT